MLRRRDGNAWLEGLGVVAHPELDYGHAEIFLPGGAVSAEVAESSGDPSSVPGVGSSEPQSSGSTVPMARLPNVGGDGRGFMALAAELGMLVNLEPQLPKTASCTPSCACRRTA